MTSRRSFLLGIGALVSASFVTRVKCINAEALRPAVEARWALAGGRERTPGPLVKGIVDGTFGAQGYSRRMVVEKDVAPTGEATATSRPDR